MKRIIVDAETRNILLIDQDRAVATVNPLYPNGPTARMDLKKELERGWCSDNPSPLKGATFERYRRTQVAELAPWTLGFPMTGVSVSEEDRKAGSPNEGDMIARNPANHEDKWLVSAAYFKTNFEPGVATPTTPPAQRVLVPIGDIPDRVTARLSAAIKWHYRRGGKRVMVLTMHPDLRWMLAHEHGMPRQWRTLALLYGARIRTDPERPLTLVSLHARGDEGPDDIVTVDVEVGPVTECMVLGLLEAGLMRPLGLGDGPPDAVVDAMLDHPAPAPRATKGVPLQTHGTTPTHHAPFGVWPDQGACRCDTPADKRHMMRTLWRHETGILSEKPQRGLFGVKRGWKQYWASFCTGCRHADVGPPVRVPYPPPPTLVAWRPGALTEPVLTEPPTGRLY